MEIKVIEGCEGGCFCINGYRVNGPKPWGGGRVVKEFDVDDDLVLRLIEESKTKASGKTKASVNHSQLMVKDWVVIVDPDNPDNNKPYQVSEVREAGVKIEEFEDIYEDEYLAPVMLTDEIIRKNGFYFDSEIHVFRLGPFLQLKPKNSWNGAFEVDIAGYPRVIYSVSDLQHVLRLSNMSELADGFKL